MYLHIDGVLLLWPIEPDSGDVVLCGDQQRVKGGSAPSGLCGYHKSLRSEERINQVHILLSGFFLRGRNRELYNVSMYACQCHRVKKMALYHIEDIRVFMGTENCDIQ